jgi:hypothetical protein
MSCDDCSLDQLPRKEAGDDQSMAAVAELDPLLFDVAIKKTLPLLP